VLQSASHACVGENKFVQRICARVLRAELETRFTTKIQQQQRNIRDNNNMIVVRNSMPKAARTTLATRSGLCVLFGV